jgi:hypothetical protein
MFFSRNRTIARKLGLEVAVAKCQYSNYDRASQHNCAYEGELNDCFPINVARDVRQSFHEFSPDAAIVCYVDLDLCITFYSFQPL